jgi:hypothetical protein
LEPLASLHCRRNGLAPVPLVPSPIVPGTNGIGTPRRSTLPPQWLGAGSADTKIEFAEQMEEQRATRRAERQTAQFVEDDEIGVDQASGDLACLAVVLFLFESVVTSPSVSFE